MTTVVLAHPTEQRARFQVFAVYDAHDVHRVFSAQDFVDREEAERVAHKMMEVLEASGEAAKVEPVPKGDEGRGIWVSPVQEILFDSRTRRTNHCQNDINEPKDAQWAGQRHGRRLRVLRHGTSSIQLVALHIGHLSIASIYLIM